MLRFLAVAFVLASCQPIADGGDEVDRFVEQKLGELNIPGLSLAVIRDGRIVKARGYGVADRENGLPVTTETTFEVASLTKHFVAAGILLLEEEGKLSLDDLVATHLDDLTPAYDGVTIRHLLTHTSGLEDYLRRRPGSWQDGEDLGLRRLVRAMPREFAPGDRFIYSNTGYVVLGHIIQAVTGQPYDHFLNQRFFAPLGMKSTHLRIIGAKDLAIGYVVESQGWFPRVRRASPLAPELWDSAAGGLVSTPCDIAKWDLALSAGRVLRPSTLAQMFRKTVTRDGISNSYGLGAFVNQIGSRALVGHPGGRPGFSAIYARWPGQGVAIVVFVNTIPRGRGGVELGEGITARVAPELPARIPSLPPPRRVSPSLRM